MFDDKDPFSNMNSSSDNNLGRGSSERDRLDIDSQGMSKAERDNKKRQEEQQRYGEQNKKGFGRLKSNGRGTGPKERGLFMSILIIAVIVGLVIYLPKAYTSGSLSSPLRSIFASPEQNKDNFFGAILDMDKTVNDLDEDPAVLEETIIYDKNNLHMESFLRTQVEPEYMVYIYTGNYELDEPYNEWITNYETKDSNTKSETEDSSDSKKYETGKYKIYRLSMGDLAEDFEVLDYIEDGEPMILIYNTPVKGTKLLDSVVKDPTLLDSIPDYMDKMVEQANENW